MKIVFNLYDLKAGLLRQCRYEGSFLIAGREDAQIQLADKCVSRQHFVFYLKEKEVWIKDLQSSNGVFLNGTRCENLRVKCGDKIIVGDSMLEITALDVEPAVSKEEYSALSPSSSEESTIARKDEIIVRWPDMYHALPKESQERFKQYSTLKK